MEPASDVAPLRDHFGSSEEHTFWLLLQLAALGWYTCMCTLMLACTGHSTAGACCVAPPYKAQHCAGAGVDTNTGAGLALGLARAQTRASAWAYMHACTQVPARGKATSSS